jgi:hypothetical protein
MKDSYKTFKVVGVSKHNGQFKVRYANSLNRVKVLLKNGHEDIALTELPEPTWPTDAVHWMIDNEYSFEIPEAKEAILTEAKRLGFII